MLRGISSEDKEMSLKVLLNALPLKMCAEVISQNQELMTYVFENLDEGKEKRRFLPVYQGVNYPGILSIIEKQNTICAERVDFRECLPKERVVEPDSWETIRVKEKNNDDSNLVYLKKDLSSDERQCISLIEECSKLQSPIYAIEKIYNLYNPISKAITETKSEDFNLLLSKANVFLLRKRDDANDLKIELGVSYFIEKQIMQDSVALELAGSNSYLLQAVNKNGAAYWITGYILEDACNVQKFDLQKKDEGNADYWQDTEFLRYCLNRLQGRYMNRTQRERSERSINTSVERVITLMKTYLEKEKLRTLLAEEARIVNSFMQYRMNLSLDAFTDISLETAIWAKGYLRTGYDRLLINNETKPKHDFEVIRRVPRWYCYLADYIYQLSNEEDSFLGLSLLAASFWSDGILMNLRMQVLECIENLLEAEKNKFLDNVSDMPWGEIGIDDNACFTMQGDIVDILKNLLTNKEDRNIRFITHRGWLLLLAKLYEIGTETNHIMKEITNENRNNIQDAIQNILYILEPLYQRQTEKEDDEFPFEGTKAFLKVWSVDNVECIVKELNKIDQCSGTEVVYETSMFYKQKIFNKKVYVDLEDKYEKTLERRPNYFLTYSKLSQGMYYTVEKDIDDRNRYCYTYTKKRNHIVGVSTIIDQFGAVLQRWENNKVHQSLALETTREKFQESIAETVVQESQEDVAKKSKGNQEEWRKKLHDFQNNAWKSRDAKVFSNFDRIALFQFKIESTYKHPKAEIYKWNNKQFVNENGQIASAEEYRRRILLGEVMRVCKRFRVEILLLPEYSVRPETVEWMKQEMERSKYTFSVWAGTFRIPPHYKWDKKVWEIKEQDVQCINAAVLPIILTDNEDEPPRIITEKYKKYPAVALEEDINVCPAYERDNFIPVLKRKEVHCKNDSYLNDVTEVICAEFLAISAICNHPSFVRKSMDAYNRYSKKAVDENRFMNKKKEYDEACNKFLQDLRGFGAYAALYTYDAKDRNKRTPIILVPACTTRTTDYYVFGQGNYLAAGLKTVFCNAVDNASRGGSCFIGPESWDDWKVNKDEYLHSNTIYHGLKPGIYMQASENRTRGALGKNEQALLICDVNPLYDKTKPNAESMLSAFDLVAHIPIIETNILPDLDSEEETYYKFNIEKEKNKKEQTEFYLKELEGYIEKNRNDPQIFTTADMQRRSDIKKILKKMGTLHNSEWLKLRGEAFEKYGVLRPQHDIPPTLIDFLDIEIDYQDFLKCMKEYCIQVPEV